MKKIIPALLACLMLAVLPASATIWPRANGQWARLCNGGAISGNIRVPVVFVNFTVANTDDAYTVSDINQTAWIGNLNGTSNFGGTQFFRDMSYGQLNVTFEKVGTYTATGKASAYSNSLASLMQSAVGKFTSTDWTRYDSNGDGFVDMVLFLFAGHADGDKSSASRTITSIYPQSGWADSGTGTTVTGIAPKFSRYLYVNDLKNGSSSRDDLSTALHELGHALFDLPDYYNRSTGSPSYGSNMGYWDTQDYGLYLSTGSNPVPGYSAFSRMLNGWLTPTLLNEPQHCKLSPLSDAAQCYMIKDTETHYYLLENRRAVSGSWDNGLASGLIVTEVNENGINSWIVNHGSNDGKVKVLTANKMTFDSSNYGTNLASQPFGGSVRSIDSSYGSTFATKTVTNITLNSDGTIEFDYGGQPDEPGTKPQGTTTTASFDDYDGNSIGFSDIEVRVSRTGANQYVLHSFLGGDDITVDLGAIADGYQEVAFSSTNGLAEDEYFYFDADGNTITAPNGEQVGLLRPTYSWYYPDMRWLSICYWSESLSTWHYIEIILPELPLSGSVEGETLHPMAKKQRGQEVVKQVTTYQKTTTVPAAGTPFLILSQNTWWAMTGTQGISVPGPGDNAPYADLVDVEGKPYTFTLTTDGYLRCSNGKYVNLTSDNTLTLDATGSSVWSFAAVNGALRLKTGKAPRVYYISSPTANAGAFTGSNAGTVSIYVAAGTQDVTITEYVDAEPLEFSITAPWTTLYSTDAYKLPGTDLVGYFVPKASASGMVETSEVYHSGDIVPAGTALLLTGTQGEYSATLYEETSTGDETASAYDWANLLEGTRTQAGMTASARSGVYYYQLDYNPAGTAQGFYWGAENGAAFHLPLATSAYLAVDRTQAAGLSALRLPGQELLGDVNLDGKVDIADVTTLVDIILGKGPAVHGNDDINASGTTDIADVTALVDIILGK